MKCIVVNGETIDGVGVEQATGAAIKVLAADKLGYDDVSHRSYQLLGNNRNGTDSVIGDGDIPWHDSFTMTSIHDNA